MPKKGRITPALSVLARFGRLQPQMPVIFVEMFAVLVDTGMNLFLLTAPAVPLIPYDPFATFLFANSEARLR